MEKNVDQRVEPKQLGGITGRGFLRSRSGNPNGRPRTRGLVSALRAVVSKTGNEATIGILNEGDFFGEGCLTGQPFRMCSVTAMTDCSVMRIDKKAMVEALHRET